MWEVNTSLNVHNLHKMYAHWKYEQGGNIELATLLRVLNLLGVTLGEFFDGFD